MKVRVDEKSSKRGIPSILGRFSSFYFLVASPGTEMNVNFHNTDRKKKKNRQRVLILSKTEKHWLYIHSSTFVFFQLPVTGLQYIQLKQTWQQQSKCLHFTYYKTRDPIEVTSLFTYISTHNV